jgi:hypothetical protein
MKNLLFLICLVTLGTSTYGQRIALGPKVGLNVSNYSGGDFESTALVGFHLGGILNIGIGKTFSVQPEVLFSTQGAKVNSNNQKREFKTTYVAVPVMAKFRSPMGFYFEVGPQVSFRTGENIPDQTIDQFSKNLDLAAGIGLGYQAGVGFGIGARYLAGISKVGNFSQTAAMNPDFRNSVVQLSLFFAISGR